MLCVKLGNEKNNEKIRVTIDHACEKPSPWDNGYGCEKHNRVTVLNCKTRKRCSFDFWGSVVEPNQESPSGVLNAISCYALDGNSFKCCRNLEDFCSEFGYDTDSRKAEKAYKGCEKADRDLSRVVGDYDFLIDYENFSFSELKEKGLAEVVPLD